ncbi:MAG: cbb3-type cytochrome c oxidase subunit 3 [Calditrichaeota bacterium]|nr:cbb3-type cytochrome c oxidase subunit 3 [Calditrichota bacterium]
MYKEVLRSIGGIEIYPLISLSIFLGFFILLFFWMRQKDKRYYTEMAQLPLEESDTIHHLKETL